MNIRASVTPLAMDCPAAIYGQDDPILINQNDIAGFLGTCAHDVLGDYVLGNEKPLSHYMTKRNIPAKHETELQIMTAIGKIFWTEYGHLFPFPAIEQDFEYTQAWGGGQIKHTGHTDVVSCQSGLVHILDWKSTRLDGCNYMPQMMRYLWLAMKYGTEAERFKYTICFLRDKTIESSIEFSAEDLFQFHAEFEERVLGWDHKTYCPGGNCTYCPRIATCPAHAHMLQTTAKMFQAEDISNMVNYLQEEEVVTLYQQIKYAEGFLAKARHSIKIRTQANDNCLSGDGGKDLILRQQKRTVIAPMKAWPLMQEKLTDEQIEPCVKIAKTALMDAISNLAGRGMKKRAKDDFMKQLEDAGAVTYEPYLVQALVRHIPKIETEVIDNEAE